MPEYETVAEQYVNACADALVDNAEAFTRPEAEATASLLRRYGKPAQAQMLIDRAQHARNGGTRDETA